MKKISIFCFLLFALLTRGNLFSQQETELLAKLKIAKHDTDAIKIYKKLTDEFHNQDVEKAMVYANKGIGLCRKNKLPVKEARFYSRMADAYWFSGDVSTAMEYYLKELKIGDSLNNKKLIADAKFNIGWIKAIQQKIVGQEYYLYESYAIYVEQKDTLSIVQLSDALASFYKNHDDVFIHANDSCDKYYANILKLLDNPKFRNNNVGGIYSNIAGYYVERKEYDKSLAYGKKAVEMSKADGQEYALVASYMTLALSYSQLDSVAKAKKVILDLMPYFSNPVHQVSKQGAYQLLAELYKAEGNYKKAFDYLQRFKNLSDTINRQVFDQSLMQKESDYKFDKKNKELEALELTNQMQVVKNKQNTYIIVGLGVFAVLILFFLYNLSKSNKSKQLANKKLSEQNKIIADKKEEIEQSIQYAKGIQNAILPSPSELKKILPQSFICYLPKDVVSGDFYWFVDVAKDTPGKTNNGILIAAADCTGHGVPGSLMSIVSVDKLNHAFFGKKYTSPSQILKSINNDIKNALKQDDQNSIQKDGLDIALLFLNTETNQLVYSGANRPLWIIRNGEIIEYKSTKTSIAGHTLPNAEFEEQTIQLQKNDFVVISSDGYADQFGGSNGKKLMTRNFKQYLRELAPLAMTDIEQQLLTRFHGWKAGYEQVDDVLVIGFKI